MNDKALNNDKLELASANQDDISNLDDDDKQTDIDQHSQKKKLSDLKSSVVLHSTDEYLKDLVKENEKLDEKPNKKKKSDLIQGQISDDDLPEKQKLGVPQIGITIPAKAQNFLSKSLDISKYDLLSKNGIKKYIDDLKAIGEYNHDKLLEIEDDLETKIYDNENIKQLQNMSIVDNPIDFSLNNEQLSDVVKDVQKLLLANFDESVQNADFLLNIYKKNMLPWPSGVDFQPTTKKIITRKKIFWLGDKYPKNEWDLIKKNDKNQYVDSYGKLYLIIYVNQKYEILSGKEKINFEFVKTDDTELFFINQKYNGKTTEEVREEVNDIFKINFHKPFIIPEFQQLLSQDLQEDMFKIKFYMIVGMINAVIPIYNLQEWQIKFLLDIYNSRSFKLNNNLMMFEMSTGKNFAGLLIALFSIISYDDDELFLPFRKAHVIWATHDNELARQTVEDFKLIIQSKLFGAMLKPTGIDQKSAKISSIITTGMGKNKLKLRNSYFAICTYDNAKLFLQEKIMKKTGLRKDDLYYFQSLKAIIIDELQSIVDIYHGRTVDEILLFSRNYKIYMFGMYESISNDAMPRLSEVYPFHLFAPKLVRPFYTYVAHIPAVEDSKALHKMDNCEIDFHTLIFILNIIEEYRKNGITKYRRSIVFVNDISNLEYIYGFTLGLLMSMIPIGEDMFNSVANDKSIHFLNIMPSYSGMLCVNGFKDAYKMSREDEPPDIDCDVLLKFGFSMGFIIQHPCTTNDDDYATNKLIDQMFKKPLKLEGEIKPTTDLLHPPVRCIFSTIMIATYFHIVDAGVLFIYHRSLYSLSNDDYWQLLGRVGLYMDSEVNLYTIISQDGYILRDGRIKHTSFILVDRLLINRMVIRNKIDASVTREERKLLDQLKIDGTNGSLTGLYQSIYSLNSKIREDKLDNGPVDVSKLGTSFDYIFKITENKEFLCVPPESLILFNNTFMGDFMPIFKEHFETEIPAQVINEITSSTSKTRPLYFLMVLVVPFILFNKDIVSKRNDIIHPKNFPEEFKDSLLSSYENINFYGIPKDVAHHLFDFFDILFPDCPSCDVIFSNINFYTKAFVYGLFFKPDVLISVFNVQWCDIIKSFYFYILAIHDIIPTNHLRFVYPPIMDGIELYEKYLTSFLLLLREISHGDESGKIRDDNIIRVKGYLDVHLPNFYYEFIHNIERPLIMYNDDGSIVKKYFDQKSPKEISERLSFKFIK